MKTDLEILTDWRKTTTAQFSIIENWQMGVLLDFANHYYRIKNTDMDYTILETHLIFENNALKKVAVLWENYGDIRATFSDSRQMGGYYSLKDYDIPTVTLFKKVAGGGRYLTDEEKKQYFPNQKW